MGLQAPYKYRGTVTGGELMEAKTGSLGFRVFLECEDGTADYTIWLTAKNRDRAGIVFEEALGIHLSQLSDAEFISHHIGNAIQGRAVSFVTEEEEGQDGKFRVKVKWLNAPSKAPSANAAKSMAEFFGAEPPPPHVISDDDIPFRSKNPFWHNGWHENMPPMPRMSSRVPVLRSRCNG